MDVNFSLAIDPYGEHAWLVPAGELKPVTLASSIRQQIPNDHALEAAILEVVPGAGAVLIIANPSAVHPDLEASLANLLQQIDLDSLTVPQAATTVIEVAYDGADLDPLAKALNLSVEALIRIHSEASYEVAFCGFAPGFAYLAGLDPQLHVPRLATPRPEVPAGSVAIADSYSAVYPQASPGGWHLLGRTETRLFDIDRAEPALLQPGTRVRFAPQRAVVTVEVRP